MIIKINSFINTPKYYIPTVLLAGGIATALLYFGSSEATKIAGGSFAGLGGVIVLIKFKQWHAQYNSKVTKPESQTVNDLDENDGFSSLTGNGSCFLDKQSLELFISYRITRLKMKAGFVDQYGQDTSVDKLSKDDLNMTPNDYAKKTKTKFYKEFAKDCIDPKMSTKLSSFCGFNPDLTDRVEVYSPDGKLLDYSAGISNQTIAELVQKGYRIRAVYNHV